MLETVAQHRSDAVASHSVARAIAEAAASAASRASTHVNAGSVILGSQ